MQMMASVVLNGAKMGKNGQKWGGIAQWCTMVHNIYIMVPNSAQWCIMVHNGEQWCIMVHSSEQWSTMVHSGA